jgi:hypothetical protein
VIRLLAPKALDERAGSHQYSRAEQGQLYQAYGNQPRNSWEDNVKSDAGSHSDPNGRSSDDECSSQAFEKH